MRLKFAEVTLKQLLEDYPTLTESVAENLLYYDGVGIGTEYDGHERSLNGRIYRNPPQMYLNLPIKYVLVLEGEGIDLDTRIILTPDEDGNVVFERTD